MNKFWNKAETTNDIYIYGEIASERFFDSDFTAKEFLTDLKSFNGENFNLHINSPGGDIFSATAIFNVIKNYSGCVNCFIEGLAASAATIITCACDHVTISNNALFMLHNPSVGLGGFFDESEIAKVQNSLNAVKNSIITTYTEKTGKSSDEIAALMTAETWYTAQEALENNFVDEISGSATTQFDDNKKILFVNNLPFNCKNFDTQKIKNKLGGSNMDDKNLLAKLKNLLKTTDTATKNTVSDIRQNELTRIQNLNNLKTPDNPTINAIIDTAIKTGDTPDKIQPYINAIQNITPDEDKTARAILNLINDNLNSGAENITPSTPPTTPSDTQKIQAKKLADFANSLLVQ